MKKRILAMLLCTVMAGTMLASCGEKKEEADKELVLYTWEGLFPQEVLNKFEEEKGIRIISSNFDSNETMLEKVQQSDGKDYDLVIGDDYIIEQVPKNWTSQSLQIMEILILCIRASFMIRTTNIPFLMEQGFR